MIITAKFASTCPACSKPIAVGAKVEWSKGSKAAHVDCSAVAPASGPQLASTVGSCTKCHGRSCTKCHGPCKAGYTTCYRCSPAAKLAAKTCKICGHVERRNSRGYVDGSWVRGGECQDCREERAMGY